MKLLDIILEGDEDRKIKKAKTVYKAYKKGFILKKGEHGSIIYVLPDEYDVKLVDGNVIIEVGYEGDSNDVKFFFDDHDERGLRPFMASPQFYRSFVEKIYEKFFHNFEIKLISK
jgi:hypothetical protein